MVNRTAKGEATAKLIRQAILRIKKGSPKRIAKSRKMSVSSVADECALSRAAILKYPELVVQIKAEAGSSTKEIENKKHNDLKAEKQKNRVLREKVAALQKNIQNLVSINASLTAENIELKTILQSGNIEHITRNHSKSTSEK